MAIVLTSPPRRTPSNYPHLPYIFRNYNHRPTFCFDNIGLSSLKFFCWAHKFCLFMQEWRFSRSGSSNVIDVGTNRKRVCDFLLVRNLIGPILHRFGDFARFVLLTPPLFHPNFGVFPLHQIAHVRVSAHIGLKLFGREIILRRIPNFQPMWSRYLNVTDRLTTCNLITALCVASSGKNRYVQAIWSVNDRLQLR